MAPTKLAAEAQSLPISSQQKIAIQPSSYMGWPEHLMQKVGYYKHPFL